VRLEEHRFYTWCRELDRRDAQGFLLVRIVADDVSAAGGALEIVLPGGRIISVAPGFHAPMLRQLLAVLEGNQQC
jgi:hypothetical protein